MAVGWWYLSFANEQTFLGGCFVLASGMGHAILEASRIGCDTDDACVSILGYPVEDMSEVPPWRLRNRLLCQGELDAWRPTSRLRP